MTGAADPPRSRRVLRLIALAERIVRGLLLLAAGIYLLSHLGSDLGHTADRIMRAVELDPRRPLPAPDRRVPPPPARLRGAHRRARLALGYGVLELVEGTGLWLDQLWAEYLTVIATRRC